MTLEEAMNKAAAELPIGAEIALIVENGAATISANDWDGHFADIDGADKTIVELVLEHLEWCKTQGGPPPSNA